jgi:hypothetical protein
MLLREFLNRTGEGKAAVVGWGRGMGHKGHMYLASSVITQAKDHGADPYFVVSRTVGKDDPITPDEKLSIYKKVFPKHGHIFHTATDEMPDLTRVLTQLSKHGYTDVTVVVGADQVGALSYVKNYNGKPDKAGNIPFDFNTLNVIARQETNDPSAGEEGPRATPMRAILQDPNATEEEKFAAWRDAMSPELSDEEVRELMNKAQQRMADPAFGKAPKKSKKEKVADESLMGFLGKVEKPVKKKPIASAEEMRKYFEKEKAKDPEKVERGELDKKARQVFTRSDENLIKYANKVIREMRAQEFIKEGKTTEMHADHKNVGKGVSRSRDVGGYDRVYHMNRMMMAMAMADGKSTKKVDNVAIDTWFEKYNTMHPMTQEEDNKIRAAMKTVPTDGKHISKFSKSVEAEGGNTQSAVAKPKKNKYGI